jgi:hypothetical protein
VRSVLGPPHFYGGCKSRSFKPPIAGPGDAHGQSIARLQQATGAAVSTLLKVMVDPSTPASTKVRAADSVLDHSAKSIELEDIEVRVAELERAAETAGRQRPR